MTSRRTKGRIARAGIVTGLFLAAMVAFQGMVSAELPTDATSTVEDLASDILDTVGDEVGLGQDDEEPVAGPTRDPVEPFPGEPDPDADPKPLIKCRGCIPPAEELERLKLEYKALRDGYKASAASERRLAAADEDSSSTDDGEPEIEPLFTPGFAAWAPLLGALGAGGFLLRRWRS